MECNTTKYNTLEFYKLHLVTLHHMTLHDTIVPYYYTTTSDTEKYNPIICNYTNTTFVVLGGVV